MTSNRKLIIYNVVVAKTICADHVNIRSFFEVLNFKFGILKLIFRTLNSFKSKIC